LDERVKRRQQVGHEWHTKALRDHRRDDVRVDQNGCMLLVGKRLTKGQGNISRHITTNDRGDPSCRHHGRGDGHELGYDWPISKAERSRELKNLVRASVCLDGGINAHLNEAGST
jgi:hypothetical protein